MLKWTGGANFISNGEYNDLMPGFIDIERLKGDKFALSFVSDINNRFVVYLNKDECEELSEKLKDIVKKERSD